MSTLHPGIAADSYAIFDCPRATYADIAAVNKSSLQHIAKSPAHYHYQLTAPRKPSTPPQVLGCLTEHLTLGTPFAYALSPFEDFKTKESRIWRDEKRAAGIEVVDQEMVEKARAMAARVTSHPRFMECKPYRTNIALVARHPETGVLIKGLCDMASDSLLLIGDLKTTQDAAPTERGFGASIASYEYDVQGAVYTWLWRQIFEQDRTFLLFAIESSEPFEMSAQPLRQIHIEPAWRQFETWLRTFKACTDSGVWGGYPQGLVWASLPAWRFREG